VTLVQFDLRYPITVKHTYEYEPCDLCFLSFSNAVDENKTKLQKLLFIYLDVHHKYFRTLNLGYTEFLSGSQ
jgi:hypothetical protein